jgi:hypothetical protein
MQQEPNTSDSFACHAWLSVRSGQLQFSLPGESRFPALAHDTILKPTLDWRIHAEKAAKLDAELC